MKNTNILEYKLNRALFFFSMVFFTILCSCGASTEKKPEVTMETPDANPKIVFVNYKAERNGDEMIRVSVINKIMKEGRLKGDTSAENGAETGFNIVQLDANEQTISIMNIENPLSRVVEVVGDNGELGMKKIELDEAEFSIRLQLHSNTEYINVQMKGASSNKMVSLLTTKINEL